MPGLAQRKSFAAKLKDKLTDQVITAILGAIGLLANAGVWAGIISTGLYHEGWREQNLAWIPLFVVVFLLATALTLSRGGFVAVGIAMLAVAIVFPMLYGNPSFQDRDWPLITWILHGLGLGLATAFAVGLVERLYRRWFA